MKHVLKYLKPYSLWAILAPILMLVEVFMDLLQPYYMQLIVDIGIANLDMAYVRQYLLIMLLIALIGFGGGIGCGITSVKAAVGAGTDIRADLFETVHSLSFGNIDGLETGNLITRLTNDVVQVQRIIMMMMRIMVRAPLQVIGSIIMTYIISPKLFVVLLVIVPILILALFLVIRHGYPLYRVVQEKLDRVNTVLQENLAGIRVVKAFVRKDYEGKRFDNANVDFMETTIKVSRIMAIMTPITMIVLNFGVVAVLYLGSFEVGSGTLQVGKIMAFINYLLQLLNSLMMIANLLVVYSRGQASAVRINEVLVQEPMVKEVKDPVEIHEVKEGLRFDQVTFSYSKNEGEPALENISFTAKKGQTTALIGSTGSGKTTLVSLVPRLYDVDSGSITIDGVDIRKMKKASLRKQISIVLQQSILFSGTIWDNITYGSDTVSEEAVIKASKLSGSEEFIEGFEEGYKTILGQKGVNLSGGQKQRLAIARGLIRKPAILILDDSTSAVDVATEAKIQNGLKSALKDTIVLMVAQRISSVLQADQIIVLEDGKIVALGNHETLLKESSVYKDIYVSQLGEVS